MPGAQIGEPGNDAGKIQRDAGESTHRDLSLRRQSTGSNVVFVKTSESTLSAPLPLGTFSRLHERRRPSSLTPMLQPILNLAGSNRTSIA